MVNAKTRFFDSDGPNFGIVDFDLDSGPVVDAVVPPLFLLPSESNNMYAFFKKKISLMMD